MDLSNINRFLMNIEGCLEKYQDANGARIWVEKAKNDLSELEFETFCQKAKLRKWSTHSAVSGFFRTSSTKPKDNKNWQQIVDKLESFDFDGADKLFSNYSGSYTRNEYDNLKSKYVNKRTQEDNQQRDRLTIIKNTRTTGLKTELKADFVTFLENLKYPFFRRIKCDEVSVYLTKSTVAHLITSRGFTDKFYRILPWYDQRANQFLGAELGDQVTLEGLVGLGEVNLIGNYTPNNEDLTNVQYFSFEGKGFYQSAKNEFIPHTQSPEITAQKLQNNEDKFKRAVKKQVANSEKTTFKSEDNLQDIQKINLETFMMLKEVIPVGSQGKAIYGKGNYIIDGPAGTGKSTTALQKIKILQEHEKIQNSKIVVIVKNTSVVDSFNELLIKLSINNINIQSIDEYIIHEDLKGLSDISRHKMNDIKGKVSSIENIFDKLTNISHNLTKHPSQRFLDLKENEFNLLPRNSEFIKNYNRFLDSIANIKEINSVASKKITKRTQELDDLQDQKERELVGIALKSNQRKLTLFEKALGKKAELTESQKFIIQGKISELKQKHDKEILKLKNNEQKAIRKRVEILESSRMELKHILLSSEVLSELLVDFNEISLALLYSKKLLKISPKFHTIILDEYQDIKPEYIEIVRLMSDNLILTGDEAQKETSTGVGSWKDILNKEHFFIEGNINLFTLNHNFRQTYELGNLSFNYRQLILGNSIKDIKEEYFENQIGFNKPGIILSNTNQEFIELINSKLEYIEKHFIQTFPVIVIYDSHERLSKYKKILEENNINYGIDQSVSDKQVILINYRLVAGQEFPVVIFEYNPNLALNTLYVMMSRSQFDLTILTESYDLCDPHIKKLIHKNIIQTLH